MADRILVRCGKNFDRRTTIANIACQHRFAQDFDESNDVHVGRRTEVCYYRWNGEALSRHGHEVCSDEECETTFGEEKFRTLIASLIKAKGKMGCELSPEERQFLEEDHNWRKHREGISARKE
ncbi:hypothetical protein TOPH_06156 [Tolypocladium ophioglossoides CBS 100239]|uniref:Uncharacterized protein n=1 Tax=Tolypocladium ophioglossoides (strain CBS 100239) TaxID=1163406 RepID=A0A0L0N4X1_TOLOC|nr:hypothetical protein TOPH_06156 [Tolypocladium ophioglossoides CBS 100239]